MLLFVAAVPPVAEAPEPLAELWEAPVLTPADCSSAAKSACSVSSASCRLGVNEVVLDATLPDGVLVAGLVATTGGVVTLGVVTVVAELGDGVAVGLVAALEAADPTVETLVPLPAEETDEGNP